MIYKRAFIYLYTYSHIYTAIFMLIFIIFEQDLLYLTFMGPCIISIFQYISNKVQRYTVYFIWKLVYMFRVTPPPIVRSANNCTYSIRYLSHRYCYLPLSCKSWNWFECAQHTQTSSNSSTIAADSNNGVTNTGCCRCSCLCS